MKDKASGSIYAMKAIKKDRVVQVDFSQLPPPSSGRSTNVRVCQSKKSKLAQTERNIMQKLRHPFIMALHYAFQSKSNPSKT